MKKLFTMLAFAEGGGKKKSTPGTPNNPVGDIVRAGQQIYNSIPSFGRGNAATGGSGRTRGSK